MNCLQFWPDLPWYDEILVDAEIFVVERIAGDPAVAVDEAGQHLDQHGLAGAGGAVANEGEQEPAEFDEWIELAVEIIGHQHLGELHRLVFGDVVADDLVRPPERHHQRLRLPARRDVEPVYGEIVGVEPQMRRLEGAEPVEASFSRQQPLEGAGGEGLGAQQHGGFVGRAGDRMIQPRDQRFQRVLRRVETEGGLGQIVGRLALRLQKLKQV